MYEDEPMNDGVVVAEKSECSSAAGETSSNGGVGGRLAAKGGFSVLGSSSNLSIATGCGGGGSGAASGISQADRVSLSSEKDVRQNGK